jgi:hypothetical protein
MLLEPFIALRSVNDEGRLKVLQARGVTKIWALLPPEISPIK